MENKLNEAIRAAGERVQPVVKNIKEKAEPVVEKIRDGAEAVVEKVKQTAKEIGEKLGGDDLPGSDIQNDFFDALRDEAVDMKEAAARKADDLQQKLEALMRGEHNQ